MAGMPTRLTDEYDRLVLLDDWQGVRRLLAPLTEAGDAEAVYLSSMSSLPNEGTSEFEVRHLKLVTLSADLGYAPAQFTLGMYHLFGDGLPKDVELAATKFKAASNQGYPSGQYEYGLALLHGIGVTKDAEEAMRLISAAAAAGNSYAEEFLQAQQSPGSSL